VIAVLISISSGMPTHAASIQLCVQKLRILIEDSDQNLKYLGLLAMSKILGTSPKSVAGHKDLVMGCLDDPDESIRLRALDLLSGMVSKKNLMEIVKKLMVHMSKAEGTTYRDELLGKIIAICSQNDYQHISNFEWYVSVLVELSQMEGGGGQHGALLASQMMDVAIRVEAIRPFATQQMALLVENSHVILGRGRANSSAAEVLYAAGWVVGEFSSHLLSPEETLGAMLRALGPTLPPHIQTVFIQNCLKLYIQSTPNLEIETQLQQKLEQLVGSDTLEVQERASSSLHLLKYICKQTEKGEGDVVREEMRIFFKGDLNPVAPKAQKKVPVPDGLDLDAWINEPESESEEEEEFEAVGSNQSSGIQVFVKEDPEEAKKKTYEPTEEELQATRTARLQYQSANPNYLRDTPKASPARQLKDNVDEIPVQAIDLDVPLHIPGLANADAYFNFSEVPDAGKKSKKRKKKSKKSKDVEPSSDEEENTPNVFVSRQVELPEGATISDLDNSDSDHLDDPHKALGNIVLDDILDEPMQSKKKKTSKTKSFEQSEKEKSPDLVEHKVHKKKKKPKKSSKPKPERSNEADLLGLAVEASQDMDAGSETAVIFDSEGLKAQWDIDACTVQGGSVSCSISVSNTGTEKQTNIRLTEEGGKSHSLAKSLKPGVVKTKQVSLAFSEDLNDLSALAATISSDSLSSSLPVSFSIPISACLLPSASCHTEKFAELLLSGRLTSSKSSTLQTGGGETVSSICDRFVRSLRLVCVEVVGGHTASLYGETGAGGVVAFLLKKGEDSAAFSLEGRADDAKLLEGLMEQTARMFNL